MAIFSINEINDLYEPFPLEAHKIREGSRSKSGRIQWFVYLDRPAIQKRLDVLFPGEWSSILGEFHRSSDYVTVTTTISIRGVSRAFNGGASPKWADDDIDEDKEKGAATDSFRRAASLWGLGLYCYEGFRIWTDGYEKGDYKGQEAAQKSAWAQFTHMYNDLFKAKPQPEPPSPAKPAIVERTDITPRDDEPMPKAAGAEHDDPFSHIRLPNGGELHVKKDKSDDDVRRKLGNAGGQTRIGGKPKADKPANDTAAKQAAFGQWFNKHKDALPNSQKDVLMTVFGVTFVSEITDSLDDMLNKLRDHYSTRDNEGGAE